MQRLHQGAKTVDEYFKNMETTLIKIDMHDSEESKIVRFVNGLRREIQDIVELYEYSSLEKLIHLAIKVVSQVLKKTSFKMLIMMAFTNLDGRIKTKLLLKLILPISQKETTSHHRTPKESPSTSNPKSPTKISSRKCFKCLGFRHINVNCPTKATMMVNGG